MPDFELQPLPSTDVNWNAEFDKLGVERVRQGLLRNQWQEPKRSAAREWLDIKDTAGWKAPQGGSPLLGRMRHMIWIAPLFGAAVVLLFFFT